MLAQYEIQVAYSMVELARLSPQPFQEFMCYWTAFNNIYTTLAEQKGFGARLKTQADGAIKTRVNGSVQIPEAEQALSERKEIELAFDEFDESLKHNLLSHQNFVFFVSRIPMWRGRRIEFDSSGQRLNGVINVKYTVNDKYPVWSPIDCQAHERYINGHPEKDDLNLLTKQLLFVLYIVRNNTFHGGKRADDSNDREVIEKALPLLKMIVEHFIP